jgi:hypothetical protein
LKDKDPNSNTFLSRFFLEKTKENLAGKPKDKNPASENQTRRKPIYNTMGFQSFVVSVTEQKKGGRSSSFFRFSCCSGHERKKVFFLWKKRSQRRVLAFGLPFWGKIIGSIDVSLWSPVKQAERSEMGVVASIKRSTSDTYSV